MKLLPEDQIRTNKDSWNCHFGAFHQVGCPHEEGIAWRAKKETKSCDHCYCKRGNEVGHKKCCNCGNEQKDIV